MFAKISTLFVFATIVLAASVPRADDRLEVTIPSGETLDTLCASWTQKCIDLAHREAKAGYECTAGYDGADSASVLCYANSTPVEDFTSQVIAALNLTAASD